MLWFGALGGPVSPDCTEPAPKVPRAAWQRASWSSVAVAVDERRVYAVRGLDLG